MDQLFNKVSKIKKYNNTELTAQTTHTVPSLSKSLMIEAILSASSALLCAITFRIFEEGSISCTGSSKLTKISLAQRSNCTLNCWRNSGQL